MKDVKVTAAIQVQGDAGSNQDGSNGEGARWSDSASLDESEWTGFSDRLSVRCELEREKDKSRKLSRFLARAIEKARSCRQVQCVGRADYMVEGVGTGESVTFAWDMLRHTVCETFQCLAMSTMPLESRVCRKHEFGEWLELNKLKTMRWNEMTGGENTGREKDWRPRREPLGPEDIRGREEELAKET